MSLSGNWNGRRALDEHRKGNYEKALRLYDEAFKQGMNKPSLLKSYAALLVRRSCFDDALDVLKVADQAAGLNEKDKNEILINYAIVLWKKGHLAHALELLKQRIKQSKSGLLYSVAGYLAIESGDKEEALSINREALEYDDADPIFLDNMGQTLLRLFENKEEARKYFERSLQYKPTAIDTNYFLGIMDKEAGNTEAARKKLETAQKGNFSPLNYATSEMIDKALKELD